MPPPAHCVGGGISVISLQALVRVVDQRATVRP
jgi:hypothetical protein